MIILPLLIWVVFEVYRLTYPVWGNDTPVIAEAEGSPEVDNLPATAEEVWVLGGGNAGMETRGLALPRTWVNFVGATATGGFGSSELSEGGEYDDRF